MCKSLAAGAALIAIFASSATFAAPATIMAANSLSDTALSKSTLKQNVQYCGCPRQRAAYAPYWAGPTPSYYNGGAYPAPAPVYYMAPAPVIAAPVVPAVPAYAPAPLAQPYAPAPVVAPMAPYPTTPVVMTAPALPFSPF